MKYCASLGLLFIVTAASAQPGWIVDLKTGCRIQNPRPQPNEAVSWSGSCQNGLAQGRGSLQWFKDGQPTARTEGEWQAGILTGRALTIAADGRRYEGEVRNGELNGRGITTFPNGIRIDVTYRDGKMNGRGLLTGAPAGKLDADFVDDVAVRGVWTYVDGTKYEGELKDFKKDGEGVLSGGKGGAYRGGFKDDQFWGHGSMLFGTGDRYEGEWRGLPDGQGTYVTKRGEVYRGLWVQGCLSPQNSETGRWATVAKSAAACGFQ